MSTAAQRRLLKDLQRIQKEPGDDIMATPFQDNLLRWSATIQGIDGTPWQGGLFQLKLDFSQAYPNKPPNIKFISEMFHPNIYNDGRICLDMLQNQWSPIYDIWSVLTAIRSLLADPNTLSPANMVASEMFLKNKNMYEQRVREIVGKSLENYQDEDQFLEESKQEDKEDEAEEEKEVEKIEEAPPALKMPRMEIVQRPGIRNNAQREVTWEDFTVNEMGIRENRREVRRNPIEARIAFDQAENEVNSSEILGSDVVIDEDMDELGDFDELDEEEAVLMFGDGQEEEDEENEENEDNQDNQDNEDNEEEEENQQNDSDLADGNDFEF